MSLESEPHSDRLHHHGHGHILQLTSARHLDFTAYPAASGADNVPQIPAPSLFNFDNPSPSPGKEKDSGSRLPSIAECATHLELLEVFYVIRQKVLASKDIDEAMK